MNYYFPILFLVPAFEEQWIERSSFTVAKRLWETTTFDLATLATQHKLHLPYQAMDVFLARCNLEFCIVDQEALDTAVVAFHSLRLALYTEGISPFLSPFITTCSVNEYSGINSRDSESLRKNLPPEQQVGLRSDEATLEAWPFEMSFTCVIGEDDLKLSKEQFDKAVDKAKLWCALKVNHRSLPVIEEVATTAPALMPLTQSLLHIWSGLEALFPNVGTELSFRLALYLAQLLSLDSARMATYEQVRVSYALRSAVTHGSRQDVSMDDWQQTWSLLMRAVNGILARREMPSEMKLLAELLAE